jgi:hypothetical protein
MNLWWCRSVLPVGSHPHYDGVVDVKCAADLYPPGKTLRQIGAELGVPWTAVSHQLRRAGVAMRQGVLRLTQPPHSDRGAS